MGEKLQQEAKRLGLKPAQVAEIFGVKAPSVYDWYEFGRISKKHDPRLVEMSGHSIDWWLDLAGTPQPALPARQTAGDDTDPRHKILLELFDGLPGKEQDELVRSLTEKKQYYDTVIEELVKRRSVG